MNKKLDILTWLMAAMLLLATSCSHDDLLPDEFEGDEADTPYVELLIAVPAANSLTRGNPLGGEEGNGREQGVLNEDKIHDINIFFYREETGSDGKGLGMNSDDNTGIKGHFYCNLDDPTRKDKSDLLEGTELISSGTLVDQSNYYYGIYYLTLKFKCTEQHINNAKDVNFVAVANVGPIQTESIKTLGALRDINLKAYSGAWSSTYDANSQNAKNMDYFLMSTAYNQKYIYGGQSTGTNKIEMSSDRKGCIGTTTMQRLYARLDLWYNKNENVVPGTKEHVNGTEETVEELKYQIKDKDDKIVTGTYVYLTNVLPVNVMQSPSYLFKKVTKNLSSFNLNKFSSASFSWGGKETPDGDGSPIANTESDLPTNYVMERHTTEKQIGGVSASETLKSWYGKTATEYVSGKSLYINETNSIDCSIKNSNNGKFNAYYHMTRVAADNDPQDYNCNHISIISYANENTHPTDCFHSNYLTGMAFRAVYVPAKIYTTSTVSENNIVDATTSSIDSVYRYSPTAGKSLKQLEKESIYFSDRTQAETYAKAHTGDEGIITAYKAIKHNISESTLKWGFICYYNLWLRHYNDVNSTTPSNPHEALPMEYATVRNNIYRVAVDFSGPGDPTPTMREPDTMKARIFVRKWNYREEDTFTFD